MFWLFQSKQQIAILGVICVLIGVNLGILGIIIFLPIAGWLLYTYAHWDEWKKEEKENKIEKLYGCIRCDSEYKSNILHCADCGEPLSDFSRTPIDTFEEE